MSLSKKRPIVKDRKFQQWVVENHPCFVCKLNLGIENYSQIQFHHLQGKHRIGAMIRDDSTGVPICYNHHQTLTFVYGERTFWNKLGIDPIKYSKKLYKTYKEKKNVR